MMLFVCCIILWQFVICQQTADVNKENCKCKNKCDKKICEVDKECYYDAESTLPCTNKQGGIKAYQVGWWLTGYTYEKQCKIFATRGYRYDVIHVTTNDWDVKYDDFLDNISQNNQLFFNSQQITHSFELMVKADAYETYNIIGEMITPNGSFNKIINYIGDMLFQPNNNCTIHHTYNYSIVNARSNIYAKMHNDCKGIILTCTHNGTIIRRQLKYLILNVNMSTKKLFIKIKEEQ